MTRPLAILLAVLSAAALASCATGERISAAGDVHALLAAIRDGDQPAFDAHIDRPALEAEIQAMIVEQTRLSRVPQVLMDLGVVVSGPLSRTAGAILIRPSVLRGVAEYYGYRPGAPLPGVFVIASALRALPDGRVCARARNRNRCLLTFANEDGTWRLVAFDSQVASLGAAAL
jgi:hypothetical protein